MNIQNKLAKQIVSIAFEHYLAEGNKPLKFRLLLADLFNLQADTVTRKLNGLIAFTADELGLISESFNISVNQTKIAATAELKALGTEEKNFIQYFKEIAQHLKYINSCTHQKIRLTCQDIPIFYYFNFPNLAAFKLYFYKQTIYASANKLDQDFVESCEFDSLKQIAELYNNINCDELWTSRTIDSSISQVIYMSDTGKLKDKAITIAVINELRELIEIVFSNAELESKDGGKSKNLFMYRSDITISNNQIYFEADQLKLAFVNINTFNSVKITDQVVIGEVDLWISNMIKSGIKISGEGVALRNDLMDTYMAKISLLESYIYHRDVNAKVKLMGL